MLTTTETPASGGFLIGRWDDVDRTLLIDRDEALLRIDRQTAATSHIHGKPNARASREAAREFE